MSMTARDYDRELGALGFGPWVSAPKRGGNRGSVRAGPNGIVGRVSREGGLNWRWAARDAHSHILAGGSGHTASERAARLACDAVLLAHERLRRPDTSELAKLGFGSCWEGSEASGHQRLLRRGVECAWVSRDGPADWSWTIRDDRGLEMSGRTPSAREARYAAEAALLAAVRASAPKPDDVGATASIQVVPIPRADWVDYQLLLRKFSPWHRRPGNPNEVLRVDDDGKVAVVVYREDVDRYGWTIYEPKEVPRALRTGSAPIAAEARTLADDALLKITSAHPEPPLPVGRTLPSLETADAEERDLLARAYAHLEEVRRSPTPAPEARSISDFSVDGALRKLGASEWRQRLTDGLAEVRTNAAGDTLARVFGSGAWAVYGKDACTSSGLERTRDLAKTAADTALLRLLSEHPPTQPSGGAAPLTPLQRATSDALDLRSSDDALAKFNIGRWHFGDGDLRSRKDVDGRTRASTSGRCWTIYSPDGSLIRSGIEPSPQAASALADKTLLEHLLLDHFANSSPPAIPKPPTWALFRNSKPPNLGSKTYTRLQGSADPDNRLVRADSWPEHTLHLLAPDSSSPACRAPHAHLVSAPGWEAVQAPLCSRCFLAHTGSLPLDVATP